MTGSRDPPIDAVQFKGNDIDSDGDGQVNDSQSVQGKTPPFGLSTTTKSASVSGGSRTSITVGVSITNALSVAVVLENGEEVVYSMDYDSTFFGGNEMHFIGLGENSGNVEAWVENQSSSGQTVYVRVVHQ